MFTSILVMRLLRRAASDVNVRIFRINMQPSRILRISFFCTTQIFWSCLFFCYLNQVSLSVCETRRFQEVRQTKRFPRGNQIISICCSIDFAVCGRNRKLHLGFIESYEKDDFGFWGQNWVLGAKNRPIWVKIGYMQKYGFLKKHPLQFCSNCTEMTLKDHY